jgi:hypothetical protein
MTLHTWIAVVAALIVVTYLLGALRAPAGRRTSWLVPAAACVAFAAFSTLAIVQEGPLGFWPEHVQHLWGNQIFMDLLFSATVGFAFVLPRARAVGVRPLPWLAATVGLGSIGLLAFVARVLYLEERVRA